MLEIDWRSAAAYQHAKVIPAAGFAWEYLRRDDDYHRDFDRVNRRKSPALQPWKRSHSAGGYDFPRNPLEPADRESVFWIPSLQPEAVLLSGASPARAS